MAKKSSLKPPSFDAVRAAAAPGRILDRVVGHEGAIAALLKACEENRLPSAMIFSGPSGVGKKMTALGLTQALVCERSRRACGICGPCLRVALGQSESLFVVEPEGIAIKIEQTRSVLQFLSLQGLGRARIILLDSAHALNPQAGNALLKVLEEPPPQTYFILVASQASALLPTIRSRAQMIRFAPLTDAELVRALAAMPGAIDLEKTPTNKIDLNLDRLPPKKPPPLSSAELSGARGSVEEALRLRQDAEATGEIRASLRDFLASPGGSFPAAALARIREACDDRNKALQAMRIAQELARDLAHRAISPAAKISSAGQLRLALNLGSFALAAERDIAGNIDRALVFENLWLDWSQARERAQARSESSERV